MWDFVGPCQDSRDILRAAGEPKKLQPLYLKGHAAEIGKDDCLVTRMGILAEMGWTKRKGRKRG